MNLAELHEVPTANPASVEVVVHANLQPPARSIPELEFFQVPADRRRDDERCLCPLHRPCGADDDVGAGPLVNADGETVNLYGYASTAVAAVQAQEKRIRQLEAEVSALRQLVSERPRHAAHLR